MNFKMILNTLGKILFIEAILLILPLIVSLIYQENTYMSFIITIGILLIVSCILLLIKPKKKNMFVREGFIITGLSWIFLSLFGCLPFVISKEIPLFIDALFETISGFTTTGATILSNVEGLSKGMLFTPAPALAIAFKFLENSISCIAALRTKIASAASIVSVVI